MGNSFVNCVNASTINPSSEESFTSSTLIKVKQTPVPQANINTNSNTNSALCDIIHQYPFTYQSVKSFFLNSKIPNIAQENTSFNPLSTQNAFDSAKDSVSFSTTVTITIPNKGSRHCRINQLDFQIEHTSKFFKAAVIETHFAFEFMLLPIGFIEYNECIYIAYPDLSLSLEDLITKDSLDLKNKLIIIKNIISALRTIYDNELSIDNLQLRNIQFTNKRLCLKLQGISDASDNDTKREREDDIYSLGVIVLCLFANCLIESCEDEDIMIAANEIENVYHRAFAIGLVRKKKEDRPKLNAVIKVFNEMILKNDIGVLSKDDIEQYTI